MRWITLLMSLSLSLISSAAEAQSLTDQLKGMLGEERQQEQPQENETGLSEDQMTAGFRQALEKGVKFAIGALGVEGGFLDNERVRIPLPDEVESLAKAARKLGADRYVDDLENTLNRAAEQAVPATLEVFTAAIENMTVEDAVSILRGPDDAATRYFRDASGDALKDAIHPLVSEATDSAGATQAYKRLQDKGGNMLSSFMGGGEEADLDSYVTDKAMDALFLYIAEQERLIRTDPVARTTDLLKSLFGDR